MQATEKLPSGNSTFDHQQTLENKIYVKVESRVKIFIEIC